MPNLVGIHRLNHRAGKYIMMFWAQGQFCAILRVIVNYSEIKELMDWARWSKEAHRTVRSAMQKAVENIHGLDTIQRPTLKQWWNLESKLLIDLKLTKIQVTNTLLILV